MKEMSLEERIKGLEKKIGKEMTKVLMIVFEIIAIMFLVFSCIWWRLIDNYEELMDLGGFFEDFATIILWFFISLTIVFSLSGLILFLLSFEYKEN